jgi:hypothetical protein
LPTISLPHCHRISSSLCFTHPSLYGMDIMFIVAAVHCSVLVAL